MAERISKKINIGPADLIFKRNGMSLPVYLGLTKDGVEIEYTTEWYDLTSDQTGKTKLDQVLIGENIKLESKVMDTSLEKISIIMPTASAVKDGQNIKAVTFGNRPGLRVSDHSGTLIVHPISLPTGDTSKDVIIYNTANTGNLNLAFKLEEEWIIPTKFEGLFEDLRKDGDHLFRIGEDIPDPEDNRRVVKFWITPANPEVNIGDTVSFKANAMFESGETEDVTEKCVWTSSEASKVTISGSGATRTATAVATGSAIIRAEFIGYANSTVMVVK